MAVGDTEQQRCLIRGLSGVMSAGVEVISCEENAYEKEKKRRAQEYRTTMKLVRNLEDLRIEQGADRIELLDPDLTRKVMGYLNGWY